MKPRASASFCHWPKLTSTPSGQVGPSCVSRPAGSRTITSSAPARLTAVATAALVVEPRQIADADGVPGAELEAEEVLEGAGEPRAPVDGGNAREVGSIDEDAAARRLVHLRQQLDQRRLAGAVLADDRDHRAGRQIEIDVVEHEPLGAGIRKRDVIEADALGQALRAPADRPLPTSDRRIVLEPGQAPRGIHPDAAQEADLADGGADVERQPRAGGQRQQHVAGRRARGPTTRRRSRRRTPAPKIAHASVCQPADAQRAAAIGRLPRSHACRRCSDQAIARCR